MLIALSIAALLLVLSGVGILDMAGLRRWSVSGDEAGLSRPFIYLGVGLLGNLLFNQLGGSLALALAASGMAAAWGLVKWVIQARGWPAAASTHRLGIGVAATLTLAGASFFPGILEQPLSAWDARSIWFFHAKLIYYHGGLNPSANWNNPSYAFSHPGYPKLVPVLAAEAARLSGYWNEFLPKASLCLVLLAAFVALGSLVRRPISCAVLLGGVVLAVRTEYGTGYMDGYFAIYFALTLVFWAQWLESGAASAFVSGAVSLALAASLKNEGMLATLTLGTVVATLAFLRPPPADMPKREPMRMAFVLMLAFAPVICWTVLKWKWHLPGDFEFGPGAWARGKMRLAQWWGGNPSIYRSVVRDSRVLPVLRTLVVTACAPAILAIVRRKNLFRLSYLPLAASLLYLLGLCLIYLCTPNDLNWHLATSASRTSMAPALGLTVAIWAWLAAIESPELPTAAGDEDLHKGQSRKRKPRRATRPARNRANASR